MYDQLQLTFYGCVMVIQSLICVYGQPSDEMSRRVGGQDQTEVYLAKPNGPVQVLVFLIHLIFLHTFSPFQSSRIHTRLAKPAPSCSGPYHLLHYVRITHHLRRPSFKPDYIRLCFLPSPTNLLKQPTTPLPTQPRFTRSDIPCR